MDKASYYPNICFAVKVKVLDAEEVYASQDLGAANYEIRHFIDKKYLLSIPGGQEYLDTLVAPTPPCSELYGTKRETRNEIVVGMLSKRLKVAIYVGARNGWKLSKLSNVLVIEELPVPIHVSLKSLKVYPDEQPFNFDKDVFPVSYHSHPYWTSDLENLGSVFHMTGEENKRLKQNVIEGRTGRPDTNYTGRACSNCGKLNCTLQCSQCKSVSYCSKDCQRKDWPRHKKVDCSLAT